MKPAYFAIVRDVLLLLPRLLFVGLQLLLRQGFSKPSNRLRKFTSVEWLAEHLDLDPRLIDSATVEEAHTGTATRSRLMIRYAGHLETPPGPPSLFIKSTQYAG